MTIASAANLKITHTPGAGCQSQSIWEDSIYGGQKIIRVGRSGVGRAWFVSVEAPTPIWRMARCNCQCNVQAKKMSNALLVPRPPPHRSQLALSDPSTRQLTGPVLTSDAARRLGLRREDLPPSLTGLELVQLVNFRRASKTPIPVEYLWRVAHRRARRSSNLQARPAHPSVLRYRSDIVSAQPLAQPYSGPGGYAIS